MTHFETLLQDNKRNRVLDQVQGQVWDQIFEELNDTL
jgi:methionine salvage enolase-phosphatase E1